MHTSKTTIPATSRVDIKWVENLKSERSDVVRQGYKGDVTRDDSQYD